MSRFHLLLSACCAVFVYVCLSLLGGQEGIWAYKQLQSHKILLVQHVDFLQQLNEQLTIDSNALKNDKDVLAAYAKKMGFIQDGEKLVKISGIPDSPIFTYNAGTKILRPEIIYVPEWIAKSIGFIVFLFYNLISALVYVKKNFRSHDSIKI